MPRRAVVRAVVAIAALSAFGLGAPACATGEAAVADQALLDPGSGKRLPVGDLAGSSGYAVLVFFSAHCPCQRAHDARLVALAEGWRARGVATWAVASEADFDASTIEAERAARGYAFPILVDREARLARAAGAVFATHALVVDWRGRVRYSGAIDSDAVTLHGDARTYLSDAVEAIVAGRASAAGGEPRGCVLRKP